MNDKVMVWNGQNKEACITSPKNVLLALYEKTIYRNDGNGFCILGMTSEDEEIPEEARNGYYKDNKIHFSVKGYYLPTVHDVMLELAGAWEKSKYGLQFSVDSFSEVIPKTKNGIAAYLSSGLIKGIGKATADLIVAKFGMDTLDIIEKEPKRLLEIKRISEKKLKQIMDSYASSKGLQEIMTFLAPYGVTPNKAKKIQERFGSRSIDVIRNSPYLLCEISGFGFRTVDEIARNINFKPSDPLRLEGGISFVLEEAKDSGDLFLQRAGLLDRATELLTERIPQGSVTEKMIQKTLSEMCSFGKLYADQERIYLPQLFHYEEQAAKCIAKLLIRKPESYPQLDEFLQEAQRDSRILLSEKQAEAVRMCMENSFSVITGGPGTGKTTVLKTILAVYEKLQPGKEILLTAPTGRAARRMAESTGFPSASTLHSALGLMSEEMNYDEETVMRADFIIVDETSMMDMQLAYYLLNSLGTGAKLLFVGDVNQLPSVGAGNVLNEVIASGIVPTTVLDMVFRQKDTSRIPLNAHSIQAGETKLLYGEDFIFLPAENAEDAANIIKNEYRKQVAEFGLEQTQVLTPFRVKSEAGAVMLNQSLREIVNPCVDKRLEASLGNRRIRYKDKVMQTKNMNEVSNGDIGFVSMIDQEDECPVTITFSDNRVKTYGTDELNCIDLAYAMTIHKSQGGEFGCVIIPVLSMFYVMLQRALIYTAITRAKKKVILVGQKRALFTAIHRNDAIKRNTVLGMRIQNEVVKLKQKKGKKTVKRKKEEGEQMTL